MSGFVLRVRMEPPLGFPYWSGSIHSVSEHDPRDSPVRQYEMLGSFAKPFDRWVLDHVCCLGRVQEWFDCRWEVGSGIARVEKTMAREAMSVFE